AIATPASLDDCVGGLDCARRVRSHQSHRAGASSRLGTRNIPRVVVRVWRLVTLRISHTGRLCDLEKVATHASAPRATRPAPLLLFTAVLRCMGHLRSGAALDPDPSFRPTYLSCRSAGRSGEVLASVWCRMVELDLHYSPVWRGGLSLCGRNRARNALLHRRERTRSASRTPL